MAPEFQYLGGIFSGRTAPRPDMVRLWLITTRTALGWSLPDAAKHSGSPIADIARLEQSGEAQNQEDDAALCNIANAYERALPVADAGNAGAIARTLKSFASGLNGDWNFQLARYVRQRRDELGLSTAQLVERSDGKLTDKDIDWAQWAGELNDYGGGARALARALELPFFAVRLLLEREITETDVDEWIAWRAAQQQPATRRATSRKRRAA